MIRHHESRTAMHKASGQIRQGTHNTSPARLRLEGESRGKGMSLWALIILLAFLCGCGGPAQDVQFTITSEGIKRNGKLTNEAASAPAVAFEFLKNPAIDVLISKDSGGLNKDLADVLGSIHLPDGTSGTVRLRLTTPSGGTVEIPWDVHWVFLDANGPPRVSVGGSPLAPVPNLDEVVNFIKAAATFRDDDSGPPPVLIATDGASPSQLQAAVEIVKGATDGKIYRLTETVEVVR